MRYPVSSNATTPVPHNGATGATGTCTLISITTGRMFWLRGLSMKATGTSGDLEIYDATANSTATSGIIRCLLSSATAVAGNVDPAIYNFSPPGIKFSNNYILARLAASGAIGIGGLNLWGYEE